MSQRAEEAPEPTATTSNEPSRKRKRSGGKRGERGLNKFPDDIYAILEVSPTGQPTAPLEALSKYRNAIGFCVRDMLDVTNKTWAIVSDDDKTRIWEKMKTRFQFPRAIPEALVKDYTLKQAAVSFRNWRSDLNTKFAMKGLDPTTTYKITKGQWAVFQEQRKEEEFIALSKSNSDLAKKNKYHHRLGSGGYQRQATKWQQEEAARKEKGLPVLSEQVGERSANWIRARKPKETDSGLSFADPQVEEV